MNGKMSAGLLLRFPSSTNGFCSSFGQLLTLQIFHTFGNVSLRSQVKRVG